MDVSLRVERRAAVGLDDRTCRMDDFVQDQRPLRACPTPERIIVTGVVACVSEDDTGVFGANFGVLAVSGRVLHCGRGRQWHGGSRRLAQTLHLVRRIAGAYGSGSRGMDIAVSAGGLFRARARRHRVHTGVWLGLSASAQPRPAEARPRLGRIVHGQAAVCADTSWKCSTTSRGRNSSGLAPAGG